MTPTVNVDCSCGWDGCYDFLARPVAELKTHDIVLGKSDRTRVAAYRAFAELGHAPETLTPSTMPVRLHDGPMPWAFFESLPTAGDSFAGITLRIPLAGEDQFHSRLDTSDYAVYACVSDAPVRGAWRFHFAGVEAADAAALDAIREEA